MGVRTELVDTDKDEKEEIRREFVSVVGGITNKTKQVDASTGGIISHHVTYLRGKTS
jgi:hypothetical protein